MKILVTLPTGVIRDSFFTPSVIQKLQLVGHVVWNESTENFNPQELKEKLRGVDVCITGWGTQRLDASVLEYADALKLVAHSAGSVSGIISESLYQKGVRVISGNEVFAESVAEGVIAYILCALRDFPAYLNYIPNGEWRPDSYYTEGLLDQTVGIVGFGAIAKYTARMLDAFKVKKLVYSSHLSDEACRDYNMRRASLEEIFSTCRIISLHSSLRADNHGMITAELLRMISDGALLVNTARGELIDEKALEKELQKGRFKAILDVFTEEPLPAGSKLRGLKNAILLPHVAGPTVDRRPKIIEGIVENIKNISAGKPLFWQIEQAAGERMSLR